MTGSSTQPTVISQAYFDEVCLENRDDFGLSEEEAIQETLQQLSLGQPHSPNNSLPPPHLTLTFPTSVEGRKIRAVQTQLQTAIAEIQAHVPKEPDNSNPNRLTDALQTVQAVLHKDGANNSNTADDKKKTRMATFIVYGGLEACLSVWQQQYPVLTRPEKTLLYTLLVDVVVHAGLSSAGCQASFLHTWPTWLTAWQEETIGTTAAQWDLETASQLLQLAYCAIRQSEPNKKAFMAAKSLTHPSSTPFLLMATLEQLTTFSVTHDAAVHETKLHRLVGEPLCRLVATLCTYDDFGTVSPGGAPTVASAHDNVRSFFQVKGVIRLAHYLQDKEVTTAILALRAMAIHDEIVQAMVAVGVLDTARSLLPRLLLWTTAETNADEKETDTTAETLEALTAVIGLFRNVCANDEIKSKLCIGDKSVVREVICAMEAHPEAAKLQEHACATFGAMALRSPRNAEFLVGTHEVATWIVRAMQKHPHRTTVQRQGALALRNLVSRSTELQPLVLQAGAAQALKDIAAKHVTCQDEVYAALRDLGLPASMLRVEQDDNGQLIMKQTEMFGERTSNFRPVFD